MRIANSAMIVGLVVIAISRIVLCGAKIIDIHTVFSIARIHSMLFFLLNVNGVLMLSIQKNVTNVSMVSISKTVMI
jgi:hypothetical protein